jgi:hypothetical protein
LTAYILYTDETNAEPGERIEFFIYGGVWLPVERLPDLDKAVAEIREEAAYEPGDILKFDTRSRPDRVSRSQHTAAKQAILQAGFNVGLRFCAVLVLHDIAWDPDWRWALQADELLQTFDKFLARHDGVGVVVMDRTGTIHDYLIEKGQRGYVKRKTDESTQFRRIHSFSAGAIGTSHLASVADIVLGSFRYCVNDLNESAASQKMLPAVVRLMWHIRTKPSGEVHLSGHGLLLRPQVVKYQSHLSRYDSMTSRLNRVISPAGDFEFSAEP